jgi:hypothetical protein
MAMEGLQYENEVIGKWVVTHFEMDGATEQYPFVGRIQSMKRTEGKVVTCRPNGDMVEEVHVQVLHQVVFHDGDEKWYDLCEEEKSGGLTWVNPLPTKKDAIAVAGTYRGMPRAGPQGRSRKKPGSQATTGGTLHNHDKVTESSATENRPRQTTELEAELPHWLHDMHAWLIMRYKNKSRVRNVLKQMLGLVSGLGIRLREWPQGIVFCKGVRVDQNSDFVKLYREARIFEEKHGRDKSKGWLLSIPIQKLGQFVASKANTSEENNEDKTLCSTRSYTASKRSAEDSPLSSAQKTKSKLHGISSVQHTGTTENHQAIVVADTPGLQVIPDGSLGPALSPTGKAEIRHTDHAKLKSSPQERCVVQERRITRASAGHRNHEHDLVTAMTVPSSTSIEAHVSQGEALPEEMQVVMM